MNGDCPDCGATKRETMVLGFACGHERCPILSEEQPPVSDAVQTAMRRFWRRLREVDGNGTPND